MLKTYSDKMRAFSYYMGNKDAPRPIIGILMDFSLMLIAVFILLYIWLVYRTKSPFLSLSMSLVITSLFGFALYLKKRTTYKIKRNQLRKHIGREYMASSLSVLSRQEFEWQIIRILSDVKNLTNIEQRQGYLRAQYNGAPIAIGYHHAPPKGYESYERVWTFYSSLRSRGYSSLFYISSGYFEDACQNIPTEELEIPISLLDIDNLLDLMEEAGMAPNEELLDYLFEEKIKKNRKKHKREKDKIAGPHRYRRFMISSLLFLGASFLFRSYFLFYFVLSILFFVLGIINQVLSPSDKDYKTKTPQ